VELVAVELRHEALLRPVQVDLEPLDDAVRDRLGQPVLAQQRPEVALQARARRRGRGEQRAQVPGRSHPQVVELNQLAHERLGERGVEGIEGEVAGEVEERADGSGDRDAPVEGEVGRRQMARAVDDEAGALAGLGPDRMHRAVPRSGHSPQRGAAVHAEAAARAGEQHDRHLPAARPDRPVAHGVHPAVKAEQLARPDHPVDHVARQAGPKQLAPRHDPMLRRRDRRRDPEWSHLAAYSAVNRLHPPIVRRKAQPNNAQKRRNRPETPPPLPSRR